MIVKTLRSQNGSCCMGCTPANARWFREADKAKMDASGDEMGAIGDRGSLHLGSATAFIDILTAICSIVIRQVKKLSKSPSGLQFRGLRAALVLALLSVGVFSLRLTTPQAPLSMQAPEALAPPLRDVEELASAFHDGHESAFHSFTEHEVTCVRDGLLTWYTRHRRRLPWRGDPPPYGSVAQVKVASVTHEKGGAKSKGKQLSILQFASKPKAPTLAAASADVAAAAVAHDGASHVPQPAGQVMGHAVREDAQGGGQDSGTVCGGGESRGGSGGREAAGVTAYATWVSEVMLQQTRVETVVEYFLRWMQRFPDIRALAGASQEDVNAVWAGLGYYRRARMLHDGAGFVLENFNGELPADVASLLTIPGIGPYTAGAISSIAFNKPVPLVDGNVLRVLSRLRAVVSSPKHSGFNKWAWIAAQQLVDPYRPGEFNQALMELGATLCSVRTPSCASCPLRAHCHAYRLTTVKTSSIKACRQSAGCSSCNVCETALPMGELPSPSTVPVKAEKKAPRVERLLVGVLQRTGEACVDASRVTTSAGRTRAVCVTSTAATATSVRITANTTNTTTTTATSINTTSTTSSKGRSSSGASKPYYLLVKRPDHGLLAGQWEFPCVTIDPAQPEDEQDQEDGQSNAKTPGSGKRKRSAAPVARAPKQKSSSSKSSSKGSAVARSGTPGLVESADDPESLRARLTSLLVDDVLPEGHGTLPAEWKALGALSHVFSHVRHDMTVFMATLPPHTPSVADCAWVSPVSGREVEWMDQDRMAQCGVTSGVRKLLELLDGDSSGGRGKKTTRAKKYAAAVTSARKPGFNGGSKLKTKGGARCERVGDAGACGAVNGVCAGDGSVAGGGSGEGEETESEDDGLLVGGIASGAHAEQSVADGGKSDTEVILVE